LQPTPNTGSRCVFTKPKVLVKRPRGPEEFYMAGELNETVWITLMHEMQSFIRHNLEQPQVMVELRHWMGPQPLRRGQQGQDNKADVIRAFELLAPGLLVDFLEANKEILNKYALRIWAAEREGLFDATAKVS
jgi:hypothetical protein